MKKPEELHCPGDGCETAVPTLLHHVRHRNGSFLRLCSSCVLKAHPGSFCSSCFQLLDPSPDRPPLVPCSKCSSVAHLSCLPDPASAPLYLCPACDSPSPTSFSYFPFSKSSAAGRVIDLKAARILLLAARLSAGSMNRAAASMRGEAEKKVREAAAARKRARDVLERSLAVCERERGRGREIVPVVVTEERKKVCRTGVSVQKRVQERERERWKRFSEPIGLVGGEKIKGHLKEEEEEEEEEKGIVVSGGMSEIGKEE